MSIKQSTRKAFGISLSLHVFFISFFIASALSTSPPMPIPHKLVVQSIALLSSSRHHRTVITAAPSATAMPAGGKKEESPAPPSVEKHEQNAPAEVALSASEEPPAVTETPSAEPDAPPPPKPSAQKTAHSTKAASAKSSSKTASPTVKGKAVPSQKPKAATSGSKQSSSKPSVKKAATSQAPTYDQKLLSEALQRLDKSKSAAAIGSGRGNGGGGDSKAVAHVGSVGSLNVEQGLVAENSEAQGSAFEGYSSASPEACYIGDLIRRLQLNIRLPEPGEVRVKLTLNRTGAVTHVKVLGGNSTSIKHAIEEKLRTIHFSYFGASFSGETEHTFSLRLSNELLWSCS